MKKEEEGNEKENMKQARNGIAKYVLHPRKIEKGIRIRKVTPEAG